jgi:hypothetical protein
VNQKIPHCPASLLLSGLAALVPELWRRYPHRRFPAFAAEGRATPEHGLEEQTSFRRQPEDSSQYGPSFGPNGKPMS